MRLLLFVALIAALSIASAYSPCQQTTYDGSRLSWQLGEAYGKGDTTAFNALVPAWNAWVRENYGEDAALLVQPLIGPADLSKPYLMANNTTQGDMVHAIDGSNTAAGPKYTTNDMNLLPDAARYNASSNHYDLGGQWLGGI